MKTIDENELQLAILKSRNIAQVMVNMGRADSSAGRKIIKSYISDYKIDTSHFETKLERYERSLKLYLDTNIKIDNEKVFVENSTYLSGSNIKKRLYNGIKERKCEKCGQDENWHGEHISLILDHINGIHNDNRLENLRILCPNCNATLSTHCRGSKGLQIKKVIKKDYQKKSLAQRKVKRPEYETLLNEIKEIGYSATGRKYGVSDNAIRKWIKYYEKYYVMQVVKAPRPSI